MSDWQNLNKIKSQLNIIFHCNIIYRMNRSSTSPFRNAGTGGNRPTANGNTESL